VGVGWVHWRYAHCVGKSPGLFLRRPTLKAAMLVLTRKKNESIVIRDDIVVTVVEIRADKVRLGIEAPKEVTVHRREIYDRIKESSRDKDSPRQDAASEK